MHASCPSPLSSLRSPSSRRRRALNRPPVLRTHRALYTEEWNWRRQELERTGDQPGEGGVADRLPRVDAASQQARLTYWTRALATLDSIPYGELSPEEQVNAQVLRASIRAIADDVRFRADLARGFTVPRVSVIGHGQTIEPYVKGDTTNPVHAAYSGRR